MLTKTKKKIFFIAIPVFLLIAVPLIIYCLEYGPKSVINKLPDEKIVSITRVEERHGVNHKRIETELPQEKTDLFWDLIKDLKYEKQFKLIPCLCTLVDDINYFITYDNHTVILSEHGLSVRNNNGEREFGVVIEKMRPNGAFAEIDKLFFEE